MEQILPSGICIYGVEEPVFHCLFGFNDNLKLDVLHHAGCGKNTYVPLKDDQSDLFLIRYDIGPKLSGKDQKHSKTAYRAVGEGRSL